MSTFKIHAIHNLLGCTSLKCGYSFHCSLAPPSRYVGSMYKAWIRSSPEGVPCGDYTYLVCFSAAWYFIAVQTFTSANDKVDFGCGIFEQHMYLVSESTAMRPGNAVAAFSVCGQRWGKCSCPDNIFIPRNPLVTTPSFLSYHERGSNLHACRLGHVL